MTHRNFSISAGVALGIATAMALGRRRSISLQNKTVFVTGGSRGLGLLLALEFARRGAKIAISARDRSELERADAQLRMITDQVFLLEADVTTRRGRDGC
jgi:NAD(P)-dependent dehydrogenase (short-subunit alcohol dehydrogenase family)